MEASPSLEGFRSGFEAGIAQLVYTRLVADLETPVSAYMKLAGVGEMGLLLESVEGGAQRGRYSVIGLEPDIVWRARGNDAEINRNPRRGDRGFKADPLPTLDALRALLDESKIDVPDGLPPMAAGVFGYMGYDTIRLIEHLPNEPPDDLAVPDAVLIRPTIMVIFDAIKDEMTIVTPVRPADAKKQSADNAYKAAIKRLRSVVKALEGPLSHRGSMSPRALPAPDPVSNTTESEYLGMVAKAKDYIVAGDIFQVVLSQRFSAPFELPAFALYRSLRRINPAPFLFHLDFGNFALVGSSPEILVRVRDGEVTIRPIAGTRPRGDDDALDRALEQDLLADPKELAEHLMLLDLGRNDVGRVAQVGSVEVTSRFAIERYSHVMHIVSNVIGRLDEKNHDAVGALMAGFPAGTVSGAPKVRAMEVIDELEKSKRGPYAGCVGYFSADGNMDTCIVLRTALVKDGMVHVQAGAGIVHDSIPENEQLECINKAKAIVRAAQAAVKFAGDSSKSSTGKPGSNNPFG
ncbi:MAG: anthranilate synthase component I [Alphaproteobacteria bacterium]|nr:anthranilate synthase component I [Alphaproteobacteria bacterium]